MELLVPEKVLRPLTKTKLLEIFHGVKYTCTLQHKITTNKKFFQSKANRLLQPCQQVQGGDVLKCKSLYMFGEDVPKWTSLDRSRGSKWTKGIWLHLDRQTRLKILTSRQIRTQVRRWYKTFRQPHHFTGNTTPTLVTAWIANFSKCVRYKIFLQKNKKR